MTTLTESEFHELVAAWLDDSFDDIDHEPRVYYGDGRYVIPDFVVHTPFESYVLEVEDGADSRYDAIGQAAVYAETSGHTPVVVFPADDAPDPAVVPDWLLLETL